MTQRPLDHWTARPLDQKVEQSSSRAVKQSGFSLIEIVVVVTIIGIVLALISMQFSSFSDKLKLKAVSKLIVSSLSTGQQTASSEKKAVEIVFDYYSYSVSGSKIDLPKPIRIINPQTVIFSQSGMPIPGFFGTIVITDGKRTTKVIISSVGRIRTE